MAKPGRGRAPRLSHAPLDLGRTLEEGSGRTPVDGLSRGGGAGVADICGTLMTA